MKIKCLVMASVLVFILSGICFAENNKKRGPHVTGGESGIKFMNLFDLDKDGKVSHDEWETVKSSTVYREKHWPEYDVNSDRVITLSEVPLEEGESDPAPPEEKIDGVNINQIAFVVKFDKNKDGKVDSNEFKGSHFKNMDKNGDGFIEQHEAPEGQTAY